MTKKKVLLMGKSGSGKTSMRSIIFANYVARDTMRLSPTLDVEHSHVRFLGDLVLNLWDCGGQEAFYESYLEMQRSTIFRGVEVLIYVFDVESHHLENDVAQFVEVLEAIHENSQQAKIFVLIHKMDLIPENDRNRVFLERQQIIRDASKFFEPTFFQTSIWFETLYKAWSSIVYSLIPNTEMLESRLRQFCSICSADEVVLFERATFLVISHVTDETKAVTADVHRFEKISNIIKQFKLSCSKLQSQFTGLEIRNSKFSAFIDSFTTNTCIMVIVSDLDVYGAAVRLNISVAKQSFEEFFNSS